MFEFTPTLFEATLIFVGFCIYRIIKQFRETRKIDDKLQENVYDAIRSANKQELSEQCPMAWVSYDVSCDQDQHGIHHCMLAYTHKTMHQCLCTREAQKS